MERSPGRIVSGARSLKSPGKRGGADFSARPRQRACQDPLTHKGGDALSKATLLRPKNQCETMSKDALVSCKVVGESFTIHHVCGTPIRLKHNVRMLYSSQHDYRK
jgi:hypothetical protein